MFTPEFRDALAAIVRDVVTKELQQFAQDFGAELDRAFTAALVPVADLLNAVKANQVLCSETNDKICEALREVQQAVVTKIGGRPPDDDEPWRASLRDDYEDEG